MKKLLVLVSLIVAAGCSRGQNPPAKNIDKIPPFKILKPDSTWFTVDNLKKNKPVMIIYFSPDCGHCQHLMYEMKPKMKQFGDTQIVMVTFTNVQMIKGFYRDFGLTKYKNLTVGTEGYTYLVQRYYQVSSTPYIAIYDHHGKLVRAFDKVPAIDTLIATAKKG